MNNIPPNNNIPPFKWFVLQNFPFIEADFDAITNYELLSKIVEYLNLNITKTNELGKQVETLTNWFNNLYVQDEIDNKLDEMVENGTMAEIINQEIFTDLYNYKKTHQIGGTILPSYCGDFIANYQFGCVARYNDVFYCVSPHNYDNYGDVRAFEISSNTLLWIKTNVNVGHGNSIAYDTTRNCFWIAPLSTYENGVATSVNYIYKYNNTFTTVETVTLPSRIYSVSYDSTTDIMYAFTINVNGIHIYKMEADESTFTLYSRINPTEYTYLGDTTVFQDIAVDDGVMYIVKPEGTMYIALIQETTTHITNSARIDRNDNGNVFIYGEQEGIEFDDNHRLYSANCSYMNIYNTNQNEQVTNSFVTELNYKGNAFPSQHNAQTIHGTLELSPTTQNKFKLGNSEIRSLNQLAYIKEPFGTVHIPEGTTVNENSRVRISQRTSSFTLLIDGTYENEFMNLDAGMIQIQIGENGEFISNSETMAISLSNRTCIVMIRNRGKISMPNSSTGQFIFSGYSPTIVAITEMNNPDEMIIGDTTVSSVGMLMGNTRIYGTLPSENP